MIDLIAAAALVAQAPAPAASELGEVRMHLFSNRTGGLSNDISEPDSGFAGFNTLFEADDLVVVAEVRTTGEQFIERPLRIVVRGPRNRILGQRTFRAILTSDAGRAYLPLYLNDITCAGAIQVIVTYGAQTRTERLNLLCGE
ncbi:MAG TPA: hypothetical protein VMG08_03720 [Allosphingosinicella sp.]|nr:hypothetical protein [Allosphingosinicella sp.]